MRNTFLKILGRLGFWLMWPINKLFISGSQRSRVLIIVNGKALLVKGWHQAFDYSIPGGGLKRGESPEDCAIREIKEELGIALSKENLRPLGKIQHDHKGISFSKHAFYVELEARPFIKMDIKEIINYYWLTPEDITSSQVSHSSYLHIQKYLEAFKSNR